MQQWEVYEEKTKTCYVIFILGNFINLIVLRQWDGSHCIDFGFFAIQIFI